MNSEGPEYHTKPSTPLSIIPVHPPEPANVTVLRNQIDPVFNMTSTHIPAEEPDEDMSDADDSTTTTEDSSDDTDSDEESPNAIVSEAEDSSAALPDLNGIVTAHAISVPDFATSIQDVSHPSSLADSAPSTQRVDVMMREAALSPDQTQQNALSDATDPQPVADIDGSTVHDSAATSSMYYERSTSAQHLGKNGDDGEIDIQQLLDNITAKAEHENGVPTTTLPSTAMLNTPIPLPAHASLPPRPMSGTLPPPGVSQPGAVRPALPGVPSLAPPPGLPGYGPPPGMTGFPPPASSLQPPPGMPVIAPPPGVHAIPIPRPNVQEQPRSNTNEVGRREQKRDARQDGPDYGEIQFDAVTQRLYDEFLEDERNYVAEGQWDRFKHGSRLFIGNLPTEKATKRDVFYTFHKYGKLAQISLKSAYGFVQFLLPESCKTALEREQDKLLRGRRMHLEVSNPLKNTRQAPVSRHSPDRGRDRPAARPSTDRYVSGQDRDDTRDGQHRRDQWRPGRRSPSPARGGRDSYQPRGGRDSYDGRRRDRSFSPPYERRDTGRYRQRSPTPPSRERDRDDDLAIPRRLPGDVPDVFIILMRELDRAFVSWVEGELRARNLKTEVMFLSPRIPLDAVIKRQILEGVHAVIQLSMETQMSSKIPLSVFNRDGNGSSVRFDEYQNLEPRIAAELVLRCKQSSSAVVSAQTAFPQPQYPNQQMYNQPLMQQAQTTTAQPAQQDLASLVGGLDNATLQRLLGTLGAAPQQQQTQLNGQSKPGQVDLSAVLAGLSGQGAAPQQTPLQHLPSRMSHQQPHMSQQQSHMNSQQQAYAQQGQHHPAYPNGFPAQQMPNTAQSQEQVQNIMAQLARFKQ